MQFQELLSQFVERIGYPRVPVPDAGGVHALHFDGLTILCKLQDERQCLFTASLGSGPAQGAAARERTLRGLLQVSLARATKGIGALALDRGRDEFVLCHSFDWSIMAASDFEEQVDNFLNELEFWIEQLARESGMSQAGMPPVGLRP